MDQPDRSRRRPDVVDHDDPFAMVRRRLLRQASIFDDPAAYAAGVEDTLAAIAEFRSLGDTLAAPGPTTAQDRQASSLSSPARGAAG